GWHSSPARKEMLLGEYRDAIKTAEIINPCRQALDEALDYNYDDKGRIEPGITSEVGGGQALHGDHVVADALLVLGRKDLPTAPVEVQRRTPGLTVADRRRIRKSRDEERLAWSR